jgi:hypothetical protein
MVQIMESKYGKANRVWVMDRGMVSEENLEFMRASGAGYLVGTPKSLLKKFERHLLDQDWEEVQSGVEVKLCPSPEGTDETFVLCRSLGRKEKENAILSRFAARLEGKLIHMAERAAQGRLRDKQKVERQIGRLLERNSRAASLFTVTVTELDARLSIDITKNQERYAWALETGGRAGLEKLDSDLSGALLYTNDSRKESSDHDKTYETESRSSIQGEGGSRSHQGRTDTGGIGRALPGPSQPDRGMEETAFGQGIGDLR